MSDAELVARLTEWEKEWRTEMGGWFPGECAVVRGKIIHKELNKLSLLGFIFHGITGEIPSLEQSRVFTALWTLNASYPDPRLWNNRIGALAGAARSTPCLGVSAGSALSEATIFGHRPIIQISEMLEEIHIKLGQGIPLEEILRERLARTVRGTPASGKNRAPAKVPGYGRPIANRDERIPPILQLIEEMGFGERPNIKLIVSIEKTLKEKMGLDWTLNAAAIAAAVGADHGLTPRQNCQLHSLCFGAGIVLSQADAENHPEGSFFPLRCENIRYKGPTSRLWQVGKS